MFKTVLAATLGLLLAMPAMADHVPDQGQRSPPNPYQQYQGYRSFDDMWNSEMRQWNNARCNTVHGNHRQYCCDNNKCWWQ